jgi:hypothetical protein
MHAAPSRGVPALAIWWRAATETEKWEALKASIRGDTGAPEIKAFHTAIIVAELGEARERVRRRKTLHGAAAKDEA